MDQFANTVIIDSDPMCNMQLKHAQTIHLLASTIKKLKNRSTVNESMEMFNFFLESLSSKDPALAAQVAPEIEEYIEKRKTADTTDFMLEGFRNDGKLPYPEKEYMEKFIDNQEIEEINHDIEEYLNQRNQTTPATSNPESVMQPTE